MIPPHSNPPAFRVLADSLHESSLASPHRYSRSRQRAGGAMVRPSGLAPRPGHPHHQEGAGRVQHELRPRWHSGRAGEGGRPRPPRGGHPEGRRRPLPSPGRGYGGPRGARAGGGAARPRRGVQQGRDGRARAGKRRRTFSPHSTIRSPACANRPCGSRKPSSPPHPTFASGLRNWSTIRNRVCASSWH